MIRMAILWALISAPQPIVEYGAFVTDQNKEHLSKIVEQPSFVIDHLQEGGYEVYGDASLYAWLTSQGIPFRDLESLRHFALDYPKPEEIEAKLQDLQQRFPEISQLISIGRSVEDRDLLVMKISDNVQSDEVEPEVKYISSMHGNEITGRELMVSLIEDLLTAYGQDERITNLINETEIYIMASMNPDGSDRIMRGNANYVDLNRDFPDFTTMDSENSLENREPETQAIMKFQRERQFALSANFHGGAEVVNYPWDTKKEDHPFIGLVRQISLDYSKLVPYIFESLQFEDGITNGWDWYEVNGGMQDWSYHWHNDLQLTIELSNRKWPSYERIPYYYEENKEALIDFLVKVHQGAGFYFEDLNQQGEVEIMSLDSGEQLGSFQFVRGEFYKTLDPGEYQFRVTSEDSRETFRARVKANAQPKAGKFVKLPTSLSSALSFGQNR